MRYGGNTSCVEVQLASGHTIVLDAGTGMRPLGVSMQDDMPVGLHVMLTHLHMDHLVGLGFFRPLFVPDMEIDVWGPASPVQHLAERIAMCLAAVVPVSLDICRRSSPSTAPERDHVGSATVRPGDAPGADARVPHREAGRPCTPDHDRRPAAAA